MSPAAVRARRRRQRDRDGLGCFRLIYNTTRLKAALRAATRLGEDAGHAETEIAIVTIVDDFVTRWIGPKKNPHA
jgi:hypothetical protein